MVYLPALDHGFIDQDDDVYVTRNPMVLEGISPRGAAWAFTTMHASNYHPLTWLSHQLDVELFGPDPRGHHATSIALHGLNAALLFLILAGAAGAIWPAALAAAFFALHPLQVESVAWVAERKTPLSMSFMLAALAAYQAYARRGGAARYGLALACFLFSLLAKPMAVVLPALLLIWDAWPLGRLGPHRDEAGRRDLARDLTDKLPYLALALVFSWLTLKAQAAGGMVATMERFPLADRLVNAANAGLLYLWKTVRPVKLAFFYPYPAGGLGTAAAVVSGTVLAAATAAITVLARRLPFLAAGWWWFFASLLPVIGIVQVGQQSMADHYAYLPLAGAGMALGWGLKPAAGPPRGRRAPLVILVPAVLACLLVLTVLSRRQVERWRDGLTIFRHALAVTENNWLAENNFGVFLYRQGRYGEAADHFRAALRFRPSFASARGNLGMALLKSGRADEALAELQAALETDPRSAPAHLNLGAALLAKWRIEEALAHYLEAARLAPSSPEPLMALGSLLEVMGRREEAASRFRAALRIDPGREEARRGLARLERRPPPAVYSPPADKIQ